MRLAWCRDPTCVRHRVYAHTCVHACACNGGRAADALLAQQARGAPAQKVHCIYKSFIMNYTMVYLKWKACLVRGYMGYRDYNACSEGARRGKYETTRGLESARNRTISCRCSLSRARVLPACAHAHTIRTCTRVYTNWYSRSYADSRIKSGRTILYMYVSIKVNIRFLEYKWIVYTYWWYMHVYMYNAY